MRRAVIAVVLVLVGCAGFRPARGDDATAPAPAPAPARPLVLVHVMPWFAGKPFSPAWGWHWTMGAFDPDGAGGRGPGRIASHYAPEIGPYDSGDPAVIEAQLLLMRLSGIDGVVADWYGRADLFDYAAIHRNTAALFEAAGRLGMKFAVCYEDQTIPKLVAAGRLRADERVAHAKGELDWLRRNWFAAPHYLRHAGRPVLLSFGHAGLTDAEWGEALPAGPDAIVYLSEHRRRPGASGAFDWPVPGEGIARARRFREEAAGWPVAMPAAFPRFHDIYAEAKVREGYGRIPDDGGTTFATTLGWALAAGAPFVQVATWNDWGEGTQVEPSAEVGTRDLETIQRLRRERIDPAFPFTADDLRLPYRLFRLRRGGAAPAGAMDAVSRALAEGRVAEARAALGRLEAAAKTPRQPGGGAGSRPSSAIVRGSGSPSK
jgi:hypothetical protein